MAKAKKRKPRTKTRHTKKARQKPVAKRKRVSKRIPKKKKAVRRTRARRPAARKKTARRAPGRHRTRREATLEPLAPVHGLGPESGGQSGDIQGLSEAEVADSESVEELVEEGQAFEAGVIEGVENAPDADEGEVRTREVPEDDVPEEYLDED